MRFRYDPTSGALYFRVREGAIEETVELPTPGSYVDVDSSGRVMGLEFLSVHEFLAFLVASGGEAQIPEQVDPEDPTQELERLFHGGQVARPVKDVLSALEPQRAQDTAGQVAEQAQEAAGQVGDLAQETSMRISQRTSEQRLSENWLERMKEYYGDAGQDEISSPGDLDATEAARQKAREWGVDLSHVVGSGSGRAHHPQGRDRRAPPGLEPRCGLVRCGRGSE